MRELNIEKRLEICKQCPIYSPINDTCNSKLWINPNNNLISTTQRAGYIRGCGCHIKYKVKNKASQCIAGKW